MLAALDSMRLAATCKLLLDPSSDLSYGCLDMALSTNYWPLFINGMPPLDDMVAFATPLFSAPWC